MTMQRRYIVCDGDVDAVWVENMNSVMDDNKLLTLPNGERIRVQNHCKLLFEVFDLQYASPATISRCGMVYVDSCNLGYQPFVWTWLISRSDEEEREVLRGLFEKYAKPCVDWILEGVEGSDIVKRPVRAIPITNLNMISQLTTLLDTKLGPSGTIKDEQVCLCVTFIAKGACLLLSLFFCSALSSALETNPLQVATGHEWSILKMV
jgi:dynein heavy chain, axonemal